MILGLDTSTRCTGFCLLDDEGKPAQVGHVTPKGTTTLYERIDEITRRFAEFSDVSAVYVEEAAKMFQGKSTAQTMCLLQRWNGMVCYATYKVFGFEPQMIVVQTARKLAGISVARHASTPPKEAVVQHIQKNNLLPRDIWEYKKTGVLKDYCYDMADAYVIAVAGFRSQAGALS